MWWAVIGGSEGRIQVTAPTHRFVRIAARFDWVDGAEVAG
jgi:hypothetical protein